MRLAELVDQYVRVRLAFYRYGAQHVLVRVASLTLTAAVIALLAGMLAMFVSLAAALWLGQALGGAHWGVLVVAGAYAAGFGAAVWQRQAIAARFYRMLERSAEEVLQTDAEEQEIDRLLDEATADDGRPPQ